MEGEEEEGRGRKGQFMNKVLNMHPPPLLLSLLLLSYHSHPPALLSPMFPLVALSLAQWKTWLFAYQVL
jgi:hypothetical protein